MKLAKALRLKNRLAGEVATLRDLLKAQNVRPSTQQFDYNASVTQLKKTEVDTLVAEAEAEAQALQDGLANPGHPLEYRN